MDDEKKPVLIVDVLFCERCGRIFRDDRVKGGDDDCCCRDDDDGCCRMLGGFLAVAMMKFFCGGGEEDPASLPSGGHTLSGVPSSGLVLGAASEVTAAAYVFG